MKWLTDKPSLEQSDAPNDWIVEENELFQDEDGSIYLVPRNYETDNYTIPDWIAWLAGGKSKWDVRPSHLHDFACQYHQLIRVRLKETILRKLRYLHVSEGKLVCSDIPVKFLELIPITKWEADCLFKRCMKATKTIPKKVYNIFRCGVYFNIGWLGNHPPFDFSKIYMKEQNND